MIKNVCLLALLCVLQGCASMSKEECLNNDMYGKGLADGEQGLPSSRLADHQKACGEFGIVLDGERYRVGRNDGLKQYCTAANGETVGRAGGSYQGVCPAQAEPAFLRAYKRGKLVYDIEQKQRELESIRSQLADDKLKIEDRKRLTRRLDEVHQQVTQLLLEQGRY